MVCTLCHISSLGSNFLVALFPSWHHFPRGMHVISHARHLVVQSLGLHNIAASCNYNTLHRQHVSAMMHMISGMFSQDQ